MTFRITFIVFLISFLATSCSYQYSNVSKITEIDSDLSSDLPQESNQLIEDDSADYLKPINRKIISYPDLSNLMREKISGKILVKMCVNPIGDVVYTELIRDETTITNRDILKEALRVAKNYKYEKDIAAPREQCGKFVFKFEVEK